MGAFVPVGLVLPQGEATNFGQKAADVWTKDIWDFEAFSQTLLELRFSLGNEGKDGKNLNSQTWPGTPRRPSPRHPRPPELGVFHLSHFGLKQGCASSGGFGAREAGNTPNYVATTGL